MPAGLYYVGIHRYSFRAGQPARITGSKRINGRGCFCLQWPDGKRDQAPICDTANYQIVCAEDVAAGLIPTVSQ